MFSRPWYELEAEVDESALGSYVRSLSPRGTTFVRKLREKAFRSDLWLDAVRKKIQGASLAGDDTEYGDLCSKMEDFAERNHLPCPSFLKDLRAALGSAPSAVDGRPSPASEDYDDAVSVMSEPQAQVVDLREIPESDDEAPQPLPVRPLTRPSAPLAKSSPPLPKAGPVPSVGRGRGGIRGVPYRYGHSAVPPRVTLRPRVAGRGRTAPPGGLRVPPTKPVVAPSASRPSAGSTDGPLDWRSAPCSFPKAPLGPVVPPPSPYRLTKSAPLPPSRPSGASSSTSTVNLGVNFQPRYTYDYAHLIPKYVEAPSHKARYSWVWDYCYPNSYGPGKAWREHLASQRETFGDDCYRILNSTGDAHDGLYLPSASALLRYCYECGAYPHLVHCQQALQRLLRGGFTFAFRPSGYLFFARSEKAFYSPFRNSDGGFSGLTVDEGRFCYLLSHTRLKNLEHGIPLAKFEVYDNEWIKTTLEQVNAARKNPSNKTLAARLAAFGENTDEALGAILSMTDDYSITVGALKKTLDTRKRSWNSE
ncbi:hypothetical protein FOZ60_005513 [Perkinsus olseni]|uniref:Uncharacterized protein n=1 Tax=Perkinsus olseni TaxID=32597 RepID=A0A7J6PG96_PEROL|nr:hypothetical protein FOZ60_005513 [Perkinsus olseni]